MLDWLYEYYVRMFARYFIRPIEVVCQKESCKELEQEDDNGK